MYCLQKIITLLVVALSLCFSLGNLKASEYSSWTGKQIIDEASKRHKKPYEYEEQIMTLIDSKGNEEVREVRRFSRDVGGEIYRYLFVFDSPAGVKGVALLTWQNEDADDDQWVYLPAMGRKLKRQAKGSKRNYFMGTDFANEDLTSEDSHKFRYERSDDIKLNGVPHFVIRAFPEAEDVKKSTGYKFRDLFIRQDIFFTVITDYYNRRGMLLKRQETYDVFQVEGELHRAKSALMMRFEGGDRENVVHQTKVISEMRSFDENDVSEKVFEQRFVKSGRHMK